MALIRKLIENIKGVKVFKSSSVQSLDSIVELRKEQSVHPKHKIVSRQLDDDNEPILVIHTSGKNDFWAISIREAAHNEDLLCGLSDKESKLVLWLYENDSVIDNYNYIQQ
jgi:hypothetical protein